MESAPGRRYEKTQASGQRSWFYSVEVDRAEMALMYQDEEPPITRKYEVFREYQIVEERLSF